MNRSATLIACSHGTRAPAARRNDASASGSTMSAPTTGAELDPGAAPGHGEHLGRSEGSDPEDNGLRHTAMGPRGRGQRTGG